MMVKGSAGLCKVSRKVNTLTAEAEQSLITVIKLIRSVKLARFLDALLCRQLQILHPRNAVLFLSVSSAIQIKSFLGVAGNVIF